MDVHTHFTENKLAKMLIVLALVASAYSVHATIAAAQQMDAPPTIPDEPGKAELKDSGY